MAASSWGVCAAFCQVCMIEVDSIALHRVRVKGMYEPLCGNGICIGIGNGCFFTT